MIPPENKGYQKRSAAWNGLTKSISVTQQNEADIPISWEIVKTKYKTCCPDQDQKSFQIYPDSNSKNCENPVTVTLGKEVLACLRNSTMRLIVVFVSFLLHP